MGPRSARSPITRSRHIRTRPAMRTRRIPRGGVTCASTTRASSSLRTTPECGESVDHRLPAHAQHAVPCHEHIEIDGIVVMSGGDRDAADVTRRDRVSHPNNEGNAIRGGVLITPEPPTPITAAPPYWRGRRPRTPPLPVSV